MKKNWKIITFTLILIVLTSLYMYYVRPVVDDELYNYGFGYNILEGLTPYKDFNMIIPPLFSYIVALFLFIFGSKLIVYHLLVSIMIGIIFYISYIKIGKGAFIIYLLLLLYPYIGYNIFALLLLFILYYLEDKNIKYFDILEPIIISFMFFTKQTLGLLVIPSLIFSKNRKKTLSIYLISIFMFLLYLVLNDTIFEFFDYCLFGMFDFANKNSTGIGILTIIEIILIIILTYFGIKTKKKDIFICLFFQIMAFPIVNYVHFIISFTPIIYIIFKYYNNKYLLLFSTAGIMSFFLAFNFAVCIGFNNDYRYLEKYGIDNFMRGRTTYSITESYILNSKKYIDKYGDYKPFIFGRFSYLMKLNHNIEINKYDIINNGNMGYNGANKYIKEIDKYCSNNKCLFIINDEEDKISETVQTNMEILNYVKKNYYKKYGSNIFSVYTN